MFLEWRMGYGLPEKFLFYVRDQALLEVFSLGQRAGDGFGTLKVALSVCLGFSTFYEAHVQTQGDERTLRTPPTIDTLHGDTYILYSWT
jgi:hypothetical protein